MAGLALLAARLKRRLIRACCCFRPEQRRRQVQSAVKCGQGEEVGLRVQNPGRAGPFVLHSHLLPVLALWRPNILQVHCHLCLLIEASLEQPGKPVRNRMAPGPWPENH